MPLLDLKVAELIGISFDIISHHRFAFSADCALLLLKG